MKTSRRKSKGNPKRAILIFVLVCVVCIVGVILLTCNNGVISSDEALEIVLEDLGVTSAAAVSPHVHEGTYENQACYNIYVTVDGKSLTYVVSTTGEILHKGEGGHSH
jgi:uncharacterized membrane protein YkoI